MTPYRAEFFDRQLNYKLFSLIERPEIKMDYLTLDKTALTVPGVAEINRGWYCRILSGSDEVYQGFVSSVTQAKNNTAVALSPMPALFDTQVYKDRTTYSKANLEGWIVGILTENFAIHNGVDGVVENIQAFSATALTSTNGVALGLEDNIHDFWRDIAKKAIENGKIVIECVFDPQNKAVSASVKSYANINEITLEADLPNVIEQNFTLNNRGSSPNKCLIINQDNEAERSIIISDDYELPTVMSVEKVYVENGQTFSSAASERAAEIFKSSEFDNLIELQFRQDDLIVPQIKIGQPCRIIKGEKIFHTVLTGMALKGGTKTLIFGGIRVDLTKILKLKGAI